MKKVAVILSGCGYLDGAEIRESVLTLLALDTAAIEYTIFAPDQQQLHVVNHLSTTVSDSESRNVLQEASRIARGQISALNQLNPNQFDGLVIPGGFGVAKNLSSFASMGATATVNAEITSILKAFKSSQKPIGAICIAPALLALTFGDLKPILTIGSNTGTAAEIEKTGSVHQYCEVNDCVIDPKNLFVTTPAYMEDHASLKDIFQGISKLVNAMLELSK